MNSFPRRMPGFHVTPRAVAAAILLVSAIPPAIVAVQYPVAGAISYVINRLLKQAHLSIFLGPLGPGWQLVIVESTTALVFFCAFLWVGRLVKKKQ